MDTNTYGNLIRKRCALSQDENMTKMPALMEAEIETFECRIEQNEKKITCSCETGTSAVCAKLPHRVKPSCVFDTIERRLCDLYSFYRIKHHVDYFCNVADRRRFCQFDILCS